MQKIGFRVWVEREALALGLKGWVRNRRDGAVEVLVAGPPPAVAALIERCWKGPPLAKVELIDIEAGAVLDLGYRRPLRDIFPSWRRSSSRFEAKARSHQPRPEERALARVSKDGRSAAPGPSFETPCFAWLLRMRSVGLNSTLCDLMESIQ